MAENKHIENIELRSEDVQEILSKVPHWMIRWGNALFLSLIILILVLSWMIKYPDVISSESIITTEIPPQKELAKITGKINAILVNNNDSVNINQPLAIIENNANYKDVYYLKQIIDTITVSNTEFDFPLKQLPILFLGDIETEFAIFENNYIQYQLNKELLHYKNETNANFYSKRELNRRLANLQAQKQINKTELEFKKKDLKRYESLFDKGIISAQEYENKQLDYAQALRNYKNFVSSISQVKESISNTNKNQVSTDIERMRDSMTLLKQVIQSFNQLKKAIKNWENKFVLKSNLNGKVSFLNIWNKNQNVNPGDLVFTIIPFYYESYIAKLKTPSLNSGKLKIGQKVNIKLENYPDAEFGILNGLVSNISEIPNEDGIYMVDVKLNNDLKTSYNKTISFKNEMRGQAEIITDDLRLIERFFSQFKSIFKNS